MKKAIPLCALVLLAGTTTARADHADRQTERVKKKIEFLQASGGARAHAVNHLNRSTQLRTAWLALDAGPYKEVQAQALKIFDTYIGYISSYIAMGDQRLAAALAAIDADNPALAQQLVREALAIYTNGSLDYWEKSLRTMLGRFEFFLQNGYYPGEKP